MDEQSSAAQRGSFLGFVAHEMRNPLSTALWSAELLARLSTEDRGGPRGEKLSGMCLRALQRLRALVEDHFLSERLDVGGIPFRMESVLVKEAVSTVLARAGAVELTLDVEEDLAVWVDRMLLERALDGLIAAAGREKSPVRIDGRDALEPPQKGTASDPTGRALALHMTVRIAQALGGSLTATPEGFLLVVPLADPGSPAGT